MQELQTQWEVAVPLIYEVAIKVLPSYYPFLHLEVVGEENSWDGPSQQSSSREEVIAEHDIQVPLNRKAGRAR